MDDIKKNLNKTSYGWLVIWIIMIGVSIAALLYVLKIPELLFGDAPNAAGQYVTLVGAMIGGVLVILGLMINDNRVKVMIAQNNISEKAQLNTRFKDASLLLGSGETSSALAGIYALNQVAIEDAKDSDRNGYAKVVKEILCAYLRENSKVKDAQGRLERIERQKPSIIFQTIVDVLFMEKTSEVYARYKSNLWGCALNALSLENANLKNADLRRADLSGAYFDSTNLENAMIDDTTAFTGTPFENIPIEEITKPGYSIQIKENKNPSRS